MDDPNTQANPDGGTPGPEPAADTLQSEVAEARAQLAQVQHERQAVEAAAQQAAAAAEAQMAELRKTALDAHRRAVLAENVSQVVPELVQGATAEEIDASIEGARAAYARIVEAVQASAQAEQSRSQAELSRSFPAVPTGASPRGEPPAEDLSPLQKITNALSRNGR